jgi:succinate dehydrogenase / fumarate reductase cytochrome b subunit
MLPISKALSSSVGKKLLFALTGLALVGFVITHLLGNLSLYRSDGTTFNLYAHGLASWGVLLLLAEIGLAVMFVLHIVLAFGFKAGHKAARPVGYKTLKSKGGHTLSNLSSRNMIVTGVLLLAFLILHVWQFRFGPAESAGYVTEIKGVEVRDLHRLVHETFSSPMYVSIYVAAMLMLGFHLRHGFWSAFQSLGAMNARLTKPVYALGVLVALLLAAGFLFIPIWIYFDIPSMLGGH